MLILFITRSNMPVFLMVTVFPDVPPSFIFPKLTDIGETEILGVPACNGVVEKVKKIIARMEKNITNDFACITLSPISFRMITSWLAGSSSFGI